MKGLKKIKLHTVLAITSALFTNVIWAKAKVNDISFEAKKKFVIYYSGTLKSQPEIEIKEKIVQVIMKDTSVWPKMEKIIDFGNGNMATLTAYQFDQDTARARITYNSSVKINKDEINTTMEDGKITVEIPANFEATSVKKINGATTNTNDPFITKVSDSELGTRVESPVQESAVESFLLSNGQKNADEKNTAAKTVEKKGNEFSFSSYILKFLAFIGVLISLVYLSMTIFKKGFGKKSKLGILASADSLVVLKTTFIAPKKSLMMVRAHNQVFLIASSEAGIQFISEIKDTIGIIKDGEKELSGTNFDLGLGDADSGTTTFKVKEDITQSSTIPEEGVMGFAESVLGKDLTSGMKNLAGQVKETVKFSDQVRSKVKSLRSLQ